MGDFHTILVVGRGSETQLKVGDYLNKVTWQEKAEDVQLKSNTRM